MLTRKLIVVSLVFGGHVKITQVPLPASPLLLTGQGREGGEADWAPQPWSSYLINNFLNKIDRFMGTNINSF